MGYFSERDIENREDREYYDPTVLDKLEKRLPKVTKKTKPVKYVYIFQAISANTMYYGYRGPVRNYYQAKEFILTEAEAAKKANAMGNAYLWKPVKLRLAK